MTPDNVQLGINFRNEDNSQYLLPPYIAYVGINCEGFFDISYFSHEPEGARNFSFKMICELRPREVPEFKELYTPNLPTSCDIKPEIPIQTKLGLTQDAPLGHAGLEFAHSFASTHDLYVLRIGIVGKNAFDDYPFEFALRGLQTLNLEQARNLGVTCLKEALNFARTDRRYTKYMKERGADSFWKDPATVAEPRHIGFRISFWDECVDRVPSPYIAEIHVFGGNFKYFTADDHQRLVLVHEETFDEALAFLEKEKLQDS